MPEFKERFMRLDQDRQVPLVFAASLGGCLVASAVSSNVPGIVGGLAGVVVLASGFLAIISGAMSLGVLVRHLREPSASAVAPTSTTNTSASNVKVHHQKSSQWQRVSTIARRVAKFNLLSIAVPLILGLVMPAGHEVWQLLFELSITVGLCAVVVMLISTSAITYHASRAGYKAGRQGFASPSNPIAPAQETPPSELGLASDPRHQQPIGPPPSCDRSGLSPDPLLVVPSTKPASKPSDTAEHWANSRKWTWMGIAAVAVVAVLAVVGVNVWPRATPKPDITQLTADDTVPQSALPSLPGATFTVHPVGPPTDVSPSATPAECAVFMWGTPYKQGTGASLTKKSATDSVVEYGYSSWLMIDETTPDLKAALHTCDGRDLHDGVVENPYTLHALKLPGVPGWAVAYDLVIDHDYVWRTYIEGFFRGVDVSVGDSGFPQDGMSSDTTAMVKTFNAQVARLSQL